LRHAREIDPDAGPGIRLNDHLLAADPLHEPVDANDLFLGDRGRPQGGTGSQSQQREHERNDDLPRHDEFLHDCDAQTTARVSASGICLKAAP
jgi:hypothetical protein